MTTTSAALPAHIDPRLVVDYDYFRDERYERYNGIPEAIAGLRKEAPDIFWSTKLSGYWVIQGYAAVVDAANRPDLFTSTSMQIPPGLDIGHVERVVPLMFDPPEHTVFRKPLNEAFSPKAMMARIEAVRSLASGLLDKIAPQGRCDFFETVAEPLPVLIFMMIMGLDTARFRDFRSLAQTVVSEADPKIRGKAISDVAVEMRALIKARRHTPQDDLVSRLIGTQIEDRPVRDDELTGYCCLLFAAGLDSVANMIAFCVRYLAHNQAVQQRLRDEPRILPHAVEELMRRHAPAPVCRMVTQDMVWQGIEMRRGDMALLHYPGANLDEATFSDAAEVQLDRDRINHLAFGAGPHRCAGRHLARIEIQVLMEELLKRIPTFRPDPDEAEAMHGGSVMSVDRLPLIWSAD